MALPASVAEALTYIRDTRPQADDKLFVARGWIARPLFPDSDLPTPVGWVIRAEGIVAADQLCRAIKRVYDHSVNEDIRYEVETIMDRAFVLDVEQLQVLLGQLSIPVFFNPTYHDLSEILIIPLSQATGFSANLVAECREAINELVYP